MRINSIQLPSLDSIIQSISILGNNFEIKQAQFINSTELLTQIDLLKMN